MPIVAYEFEGRRKNPVRAECVDAQTKREAKAFKSLLARRVLENFWESEDSSDEATSAQILKGTRVLTEGLEAINGINNMRNLPVDLVRPLLRQITDYSDQTVIVDAVTRVALYDRGHRMEVAGTRLDLTNPDKLYTWYGEEMARQALDNACNFYAYTPQPGTLGERGYTEHQTLGRMSSNGNFTPVVTVLRNNYFSTE